MTGWKVSCESLTEAFNRYEKQEEKQIRFFFIKWLRKKKKAVSVGSWARLNQTKLVIKLTLKKPTIVLSRI